MIPGFEDFTPDVKDEEIPVINLIARSLRNKIGKRNAITNETMRVKLFNNAGININGAKLRRYIQYIRAYRLVSMLCASKQGYWVAKDREEWIKYREAFRSRVTSMSFTLACMDLDEVEGNILN